MTIPAAIIFDLDGTLYAMDGRFKPLFTFFCLPKPLHLPRYMNVRKNMRGKDLANGETLQACTIADFEQKNNIKNGGGWIQKHFYPAFVKTLKCMRNRPQIIPFLHHCREQGIKTAVLSDFGNVRERLEALAIPPSLFDLLASSEEIGAFKPAERAFAYVVTHLKTAPKDTLFVGDRDDTDRIGAENFGMHFFKVNGKNNRTWKKQLSQLYTIVSPKTEKG